MSQSNEVTDPVKAREQLWELIKDMKFAMFTTRHGNGHLHSRPMTTQNKDIDESSSLWFFMSRNGEPVTDLAAQPNVGVTYADPGKDSYVSVSGTAKVVDDVAKKKQLWSKMNDAWFPGGVDDPNCALVQVSITHGDFWDVKQNKLVQLIKIGTAAVTGKQPDLGEHGKVRM